MRDIASLAKYWESRLPNLDDPWTHWRLEGEGFVLGVYSWQELGRLMSALKENHLRFSSIFANRARVDRDGQVHVESHRYEVVNRSNDTSAGD